MKSRVSFVGLIHKGLICLAKRRLLSIKGEKVPFGGYWSIFGGAIEKGESPFFAAHRELIEEAKIDIPIDRLKYCKTYRNESETMHIYFAEFKEIPTISLDFEHTEYGWFKLDSIEASPEPIDPNIKDAVKKYQKSRFIL